jgi:hypothetical protein
MIRVRWIGEERITSLYGHKKTGDEFDMDEVHAKEFKDRLLVEEVVVQKPKKGKEV